LRIQSKPRASRDAGAAAPEPSRYVVIGLGGIGSHVLRLLTHFLHSQQRRVTIYAVDGDSFEQRNRDRMLFDRPGPKAEVLAEELAERHAGVVNLLPLVTYVTAENVSNIVAENDVVFCLPDNHRTRYIVERRCAELSDVALFSAGNDGVENGQSGTYGNVQIYLRRGGRDLTNPPSVVHPEIATSSDPLPTEKGCGEAAVGAPQLLVTNAAVATAAVAAFYAWHTGKLEFEEVFLDALLVRMSPVSRALRA